MGDDTVRNAARALLAVVVAIIAFVAVTPALAALIMLLALIPAKIAQGKGRPFLEWWCGGVLLLPVVFVASLMIHDDSIRCPYCVEKVHPSAIACPHCQRDLGAERGPTVDVGTLQR
jgi:hypothetical protein